MMMMMRAIFDLWNGTFFREDIRQRRMVQRFSRVRESLSRSCAGSWPRIFTCTLIYVKIFSRSSLMLFVEISSFPNECLASLCNWSRPSTMN